MTVSKIPACFNAGDRVSFPIALRTYVGGTGGYSCVIHMVNQSSNEKVVGDWNGAYWEFNLSSEDTTQFEPGEYQLFVFVVDEQGERTTVDQRQIEVLPDPTDSAKDFRTANEITLAAIDAVLAKKATRDDKQITIDGQTITRYSFDELRKQRDIYARRVAKDKARRLGRKVARKNTLLRMH